jgi:hypothetical protein
MDHSALVYGTLVSVYLITLVALLVAFLVRKKIPRRTILDIVEISVGIFAVAALICYHIADRVVLNGGDSFWIYVPPVIPVAVFVAWRLRRRR